MTSALVFLAAFLWFGSHTVGSLYFGDNGELLAAIRTGGIPHPTGFPLFLLLSHLPGQAGTFHVNILSSALGALSVVLAGHLAMKWFGRQAFFPSILSILGSTTFLLHASMARVYTFQLCLLLAVLLTVTSFKTDRRWSLLFGFLFGLSSGTHLLFLAGGVYAAVSLWGRRGEITARIPWIAAGFAVAFSIYLWIPLRANLSPLVSWGTPDDFGHFWNYLTQAGYNAKKFSRDFLGTRLFAEHLLKTWALEWNPLIWISAIAGFRAAWKTKRAVALGVGALALFNAGLLFVYGNDKDMVILYRYFLPFYACVSIFAGAGVASVWERWSGPLRVRPLAVGIAIAAWGLLCVSYPAWKWHDLSNADACDRYAVQLLRHLPRKATAFLSGDNQVFPIAYQVRALGKRADLQWVEWDGALFPPLDAPDFPRGKADYEKRKFEAGGNRLFLPTERSVASPFICRPFGLMFRLSDITVDPTLPAPPAPSWLPLHTTQAELRDPESLETLAEVHLMAAAWAADRDDRALAMEQLEKAVALGRDMVRTLINASAQASKLGADGLSEGILRRALEINPRHLEAHLNLGILFGKMGRYEDARHHLRTADSLSPGNPIARFYLTQIRQLTGR